MSCQYLMNLVLTGQVEIRAVSSRESLKTLLEEIRPLISFFEFTEWFDKAMCGIFL